MGNKTTSLGGEAVRLTTSKVLTMLISLATGMLLSRFRTFEEYGTYSQMLLVINLFVSLLMLGLPNSINFFLSRADTQEERRHFLSVYYTLSTMLSAIIGLVLILAIPIIEKYFHNPLIGKFYYFLALYPWANIISSSIENVLVVYKKTRFLMAYRLLNSIAMLGSVLVVQWLGYGFSAYMITFIIINSLFAVSVYIIASVLSGGTKLTFDKKLIRLIFTFSIPMGLATVVGTLNMEIDKLLIGYLMDTEQMAIYTNAAKELPLNIVASSITAVLLPQLTRMVKGNKIKEAVKLWGYATELAMIIIALIVFGIFTYAEDVMTILYSAKYLPGITVFRIYTLNLLLRVTYFGIMLNSFGETRKIFYCSIGSLILNSILNPLFYWIFGMIGPAVATFISILIIQQLQLIMTSRITAVPFKEIFPWKKTGYILFVNFLLAPIFYLIKRVLPLETAIGDISESLILGGVWSAIYLVIMKNRIMTAWHSLNKE